MCAYVCETYVVRVYMYARVHVYAHMYIWQRLYYHRTRNLRLFGSRRAYTCTKKKEENSSIKSLNNCHRQCTYILRDGAQYGQGVLTFGSVGRQRCSELE